MAQSSNPFGFKPWQNVLRTQLYAVATNPTINIMLQDIVQAAGTNLASKYLGAGGKAIQVANIVPATPGATLLGSVMACFDENMDPLPYIPATRVGDGTVAGYVLVADHPDQLFLAQEDSVGGSIALATGGDNIEIYSPALSAGNTSTGMSKQMLDSSSVGTTATIAVRLLSILPGDTGPTDSYNRWICKINAHYYGSNLTAVA